MLNNIDLFTIFFVTYIILMIINVKKFKLNFIIQDTILTLWTICSLLSMFGFYEMYIPNRLAYILIYIFIISFEIFSIVFYKIIEKKHQRSENKDDIDVQQNDTRFFRFFNIYMCCLVIAYGILSINGFRTIIEGGNFSDIRNSFLNCPAVVNKMNMLLSLLIAPVGTAIGYVGTLKCIKDKKINKTMILYIVFILERTMYTGGRATIVNFIFFIIVALLYNYNFNIKKIIVDNKKIIISLFVLFAAIVAITLQRNLEGKGLIYNIYVYFVGSIHLFGKYIANPVEHCINSGNLLFGQALISGFSYPITFIMRLFGSDIKAGLYVINETTQIFETISPYTSINNNVTFIYPAIRDFGYVGIIIYTAIITLFYSILVKNKNRSKSIYIDTALYIFIINEFFLIFAFNFYITDVIVELVFLLIVFYIKQKKCENNSKNTNNSNESKKILENEDLISVIVPVYNVKEYVEQCVESICRQTYKNIEILIIDDGSNDGSELIVDELSKKSDKIHVYHKKNGGLSDARNFGISKCNGKYLTFIDSDDEVSSDYIEILYYAIVKYKTKMSIASYSVVKNKVVNLSDNCEEKLLDTKEALYRMLKEYGYTVSATSKMYEKELFDDVRFPINRLCEDNGTTYKIIMKCEKIPYVNKSIYYYYKRENSIMTSKFSIKKLDMIELVDEMGDDICKKYPEMEDVVNKKKITSRFSILRQMVFADCTSDEMKKKFKEIEKYILDKKNYILKNKEFDKRDRIALISLIIGRKFFKISWMIYCKIKY